MFNQWHWFTWAAAVGYASCRNRRHNQRLGALGIAGVVRGTSRGPPMKPDIRCRTTKGLNIE